MLRMLSGSWRALVVAFIAIPLGAEAQAASGVSAAAAINWAKASASGYFQPPNPSFGAHASLGYRQAFAERWAVTGAIEAEITQQYGIADPAGDPSFDPQCAVVCHGLPEFQGYNVTAGLALIPARWVEISVRVGPGYYAGGGDKSFLMSSAGEVGLFLGRIGIIGERRYMVIPRFRERTVTFGERCVTITAWSAGLRLRP